MVGVSVRVLATLGSGRKYDANPLCLSDHNAVKSKGNPLLLRDATPRLTLLCK